MLIKVDFKYRKEVWSFLNNTFTKFVIFSYIF